MVQRLLCSSCGELIHPDTAAKTGGLCMPCKGRYRQSISKSVEKLGADEPSFVQVIGALVKDRESYTNKEVLDEIKGLCPLADEDDLVWNDSFHQINLDLFLALADIVAMRKLKEAVPLLLDKACFGDPWETMRGLRHSLEAAVEGDWKLLADLCLVASMSQRLGTQLWAIDQLRVLEDSRAREVFELAKHSEYEEIRWRAESGIERLNNNLERERSISSEG